MTISKISVWLGAALLFTSCEFGDILLESEKDPTFSEEKIISGLKESLKLGIRKGTIDLGAANGYLENELIRVLLPQEVNDVFDLVEEFETEIAPYTSLLSKKTAVDIFNLSSLKDSLITSLNRAAEKAAPASLDIFINSISKMGISDGREILFSDNMRAATDYLEISTFEQLAGVFNPIIYDAMESVYANRIWAKFSTGYNEILGLYNDPWTMRMGILPDLDLPSTLPEDLSDWTTGKALNGLFYTLSEEEKALRANPLNRLSDLKDLFEELGEVWDKWSENRIAEVLNYKE
jgi:hypothetical protein